MAAQKNQRAFQFPEEKPQTDRELREEKECTDQTDLIFEKGICLNILFRFSAEHRSLDVIHGFYPWVYMAEISSRSFVSVEAGENRKKRAVKQIYI